MDDGIDSIWKTFINYPCVLHVPNYNCTAYDITNTDSVDSKVWVCIKKPPTQGK